MSANVVQIVADAAVRQRHSEESLTKLAKRLQNYGSCLLLAETVGMCTQFRVSKTDGHWNYSEFLAVQRALDGVITAIDGDPGDWWSCTALHQDQMRPRWAYGRNRCTYCNTTLAGGCVCATLSPEQWTTVEAIERSFDVADIKLRVVKQVKAGLTLDQLTTAAQAAPELPIAKVLGSVRSLTAPPSLLTRLATAWKAAGGGEFPYARAGKALKGVKLSVSEDAFVDGFHEYLMRTPSPYRSINRYLETYPNYTGSQLLPGGPTKVDVF